MIPFVLYILISVIPASSDTLNPPRVLSSSFYPCSDCHQGLKTNPQVRKLSFHDDILIDHDKLWCLDCHSPSDRNRLRLPMGRTVAFEDLPRLCATCHGHIYIQWSKGIHGKRTGYWNGKKNYFICTECHNPHSPSFRPLRPEPPPLRPERTIRRD
jgi:formate-dependent nitrite reductase cytochrome c552 subunit